MLASLYHGYWGQGAVGEGVVISSPGGPQTQIVPPGILCAAIVSRADGTGNFYPGYFCGISTSQDTKIWFLSLIPFDPSSGLKPFTIQLVKGDRYETVGAFPSVGVYPAPVTLNIAPPIEFSIGVN